MHTDQIADKVLGNYRKDKLTDERIDFLKAQADEQLEEIAGNKELYDRFLQKINPPGKIDNIILWMLIMSNEDFVEAYIDAFNKFKFREIIPSSDLADLLIYIVHLNKLENITLDGYDFLLNYEHPGKDEFDHYCVTNVLLYIQKSKQVEMEF